jgi:hypothetical protein
MISFRFYGTFAGSRDKSGWAPYLRLDGERLLAGPEERELARHGHGLWELQGDRYTLLDIETPVWLTFHNEGQTRAAPYGPLMLVNGTLYEDRVYSRLIARLDASTKSWQVQTDKLTCSTIILTPA